MVRRRRDHLVSRAVVDPQRRDAAQALEGRAMIIKVFYGEQTILHEGTRILVCPMCGQHMPHMDMFEKRFCPKCGVKLLRRYQYLSINDGKPDRTVDPLDFDWSDYLPR